MRQLLVIFALATLPGCFLLVEDGLTDTRGDQHRLTINWTLKQPGGATAPCPPGFQQLLISSTTREQSGQVQTMVPCQTSGTEVVDLYTSGEHRFKMEGDEDTIYGETFSPSYNEVLYITDPTGAVVRARSLPVRLVLDRDMTIDVDVYPDAGFLLYSWELFSGITKGRVHSCEAVAVDEIELRYRLFTFEGQPDAPSKSVRWPCNERHEGYYISDEAVGQGFAPALAPEDYVGSVIAYRNGVEVARDDDVSFNIQTGGALTETEDDMSVEDR